MSEGVAATIVKITSNGQISLPAELVPIAKRGVALYHVWWAAIEKLSAINRDLIRKQRQQRSAPRKRPAARSPRPRRP